MDKHIHIVVEHEDFLAMMRGEHVLIPTVKLGEFKMVSLSLDKELIKDLDDGILDYE